MLLPLWWLLSTHHDLLQRKGGILSLQRLLLLRLRLMMMIALVKLLKLRLRRRRRQHLLWLLLFVAHLLDAAGRVEDGHLTGDEEL